MATSNSTNFSTSRDEIIKGALRIVGGLAQGETPTIDQVNEAAEALNMLVKTLQVDGMPLWALKEYAVPLTTSTASYTIGVGSTVNTPKPLKITQAFLRDTVNNIDIPMTQLTRQEYNMLGNKTSTGNPIQFYYDPQRTTGTLYLFPVPNSYSSTNTTVHIVYQRPFEDFDASTDEPDFPQEWYEAIKFLLADRLAPEYGVPITDRNDIRSRAKELRMEALGFGTEEGSMSFQRVSRD